MTADFAVIFDMDGVLVDSEPLQVRTYVQAAAEFGVTIDEEEFVRRCVLEGWTATRLYVGQGGRSEQWEALFARKAELYRAAVSEELQMMPGARALLDALRAEGVPLGLATSCARVSTETVFAVCHIAAYFEATVTFDDVSNPKPDPEPFLLAASRLGLRPAQCVVIEDAPKGIVAAKAAGMRAVGLLNPRAGAEALAGADLLVSSLEELSVGGLRGLLQMR